MIAVGNCIDRHLMNEPEMAYRIVIIHIVEIVVAAGVTHRCLVEPWFFLCRNVFLPSAFQNDAEFCHSFHLPDLFPEPKNAISIRISAIIIMRNVTKSMAMFRDSGAGMLFPSTNPATP